MAIRTICLINPALIIAILEITFKDPLVAASRKQELYELVN